MPFRDFLQMITLLAQFFADNAHSNNFEINGIESSDKAFSISSACLTLLLKYINTRGFSHLACSARTELTFCPFSIENKSLAFVTRLSIILFLLTNIPQTKSFQMVICNVSSICSGVPGKILTTSCLLRFHFSPSVCFVV